MEIGSSKIYHDLPSVICERSSSLIDLPAQKNAEDLSKKREFKDFVQSLLPEGDKEEIATQVREAFQYCYFENSVFVILYFESDK